MEEVEEYYKNLSTEKRKRLESIHDLITRIYSDIEISMKYKMPTFHLGKNWVAIANQKNYISLYTCSYDHISEFKRKHPKIKTGKGCINFTDRDEIPNEDIKNVIQKALTMKK